MAYIEKDDIRASENRTIDIISVLKDNPERHRYNNQVSLQSNITYIFNTAEHRFETAKIENGHISGQSVDELFCTVYDHNKQFAKVLPEYITWSVGYRQVVQRDETNKIKLSRRWFARKKDEVEVSPIVSEEKIPCMFLRMALDREFIAKSKRNIDEQVNIVASQFPQYQFILDTFWSYMPPCGDCGIHRYFCDVWCPMGAIWIRCCMPLSTSLDEQNAIRDALESLREQMIT